MRILHVNGMTPPAIAVAIALGEKGLDFQLAEHDWRDTADALGAFGDRLEPANTLEGEFPILVDGEAVVCDSYFILEYLNDRYSDPPLKTDDAYGQWQIQALARFFGERALPAVSGLGVTQRFDGGPAAEEAAASFAASTILTSERRDAWIAGLRDPRNESAVAESFRNLGLLFDRVETTLELSGGPWLFGDRFTIADIAGYALVQPFLAGQLDAADATPGAGTRDWHDRVDVRPAVRNATALRQPAFLPGPEHSRWG